MLNRALKDAREAIAILAAMAGMTCCLHVSCGMVGDGGIVGVGVVVGARHCRIALAASFGERNRRCLKGNLDVPNAPCSMGVSTNPG